jgi:hypothetical protein
MGFLKGTINEGIMFSVNNGTEMVCYSDSDWAGCRMTRRSTSGMVMVRTGPVVWKAKLQQTIALSSCEAEVIAMSQACQEIISLRILMNDVEGNLTGATRLFGDNHSAVEASRNDAFHTRMKHVQIRDLFVREKVSSGEVDLIRCSSEENAADLFTKPLAREGIVRHKARIAVREMPQ